MKLYGDIFRGRRVVVTGHTGFKGSWLALWLNQLGANVTGIALPPETSPNHWGLLDLGTVEHRLDIRDAQAITDAIAYASPEIVFHLAAQPLVRRSYRDPLETWSTNVMGTANVLEACRKAEGVQAILAVTTDKCYRNAEWPWGYRESDPLGGYDAYSASKAAAELVAASYRDAFFNAVDATLIATARAGNVIGGGDWSEDRLLPDLVRAIASGESLEIRSPNATRPWQHVLESLSGYLLLAQGLLEGRRELAQAWNFGPMPNDNRSVSVVLGELVKSWPELTWHVTPDPQPHEARLLYLDSAKSRADLEWAPVWELDEALSRTATWYRASADGRVISREQLDAYIDDAAARSIVWTR